MPKPFFHPLPRNTIKPPKAIMFDKDIKVMFCGIKMRQGAPEAFETRIT